MPCHVLFLYYYLAVVIFVLPSLHLLLLDYFVTYRGDHGTIHFFLRPKQISRHISYLAVHNFTRAYIARDPIGYTVLGRSCEQASYDLANQSATSEPTELSV